MGNGGDPLESEHPSRRVIVCCTSDDSNPFINVVWVTGWWGQDGWWWRQWLGGLVEPISADWRVAEFSSRTKCMVFAMFWCLELRKWHPVESNIECGWKAIECLAGWPWWRVETHKSGGDVSPADAAWGSGLSLACQRRPLWYWAMGAEPGMSCLDHTPSPEQEGHCI